VIVPLRADCFLIADGAQESGGKLYVLGGGWTEVSVSSIPTRHHLLVLAIVLRVPWGDANAPIQFEIYLVHEDKEPGSTPIVGGELTAGRPPNAVPGDDLPVTLALPVPNLPLEWAGGYAFVLRCNDVEIARAKFRVNLVSPFSIQAP